MGFFVLAIDVLGEKAQKRGLPLTPPRPRITKPRLVWRLRGGVWTLEGQYDLWSMQHPDGRHKDEYEGRWVKAEEAAAAIDALQAEVARLTAKTTQPNSLASGKCKAIPLP